MSQTQAQESNESAAIPQGTAQALGRAMQAQNNSRQSNQSLGKKANVASNETSSSSMIVKSVWQHPFVDVFKHFKILPTSDWKQNKKQGEVIEDFAREIGRKVMHIRGTISANNYIQIPHPNSMTRSLGLTGRYLYLQTKMPLSSAPFSFHIDLQLAERTHGIRISASNLYKQVSTQNNFVVQLPLNVDVDRWTVIVFDLINILQMSRLLPNSYIIEDCYQIKSITLCANSMVRGVFTSDNQYDFVTLPPDMRFKFSFDINRWPDYFAWLELPQDIREGASDQQLAAERARQLSANAALNMHHKNKILNGQTKQKMEQEIDALLSHQRIETGDRATGIQEVDKQAKYNAVQAELMAQFGPKGGHGGNELASPDDLLGIHGQAPIDGVYNSGSDGQGLNLKGLQYSIEVKRSHKLQVDPVMELSHIIGYSPQRCLSLKWSRFANENIVLFTSCGSLIAMDVETSQQKRFFFGHSAPICCFDVAPHGGLIASAQEGKNSIIRIWDYHTARCLQMLVMQVTTLTTVQCLSFSPDGRYLASVGKDERNKERIIIWDISQVHKQVKPQIVAQQTADYNVTTLKFSPVDNTRLISCGKENIRFWRIKNTRNIRGSAVKLNQHARDTVFTTFDFDHAQRAGGMVGMSSGSTLNQDSAQGEQIRCVYVASKSGMIYQICYWTEKLLKFFQTNDQAIYSISVNETFAVIGSEDLYLRVWPLDFSEFFMEAKHEGPVCSIDISADGRNIACGSLNGSLGVLNKSNQRYTTLLRSHTRTILSMDYHVGRKNLITVSNDQTIRLWDVNNFDQVVEYSSPIDQALCVSAHPHLAIFACGFASGTMRVFDIEKTCVADGFTFTQFNKPIRAIAYSPNGDLLVTCCEDGGVALHNACHQHLPTKMMSLEFQPEFVYVAFSPKIVRKKLNNFNKNMKLSKELEMDSEDRAIYADPDNERYSQSDDPSLMTNQGEHITEVNDSLFAIMGEYGNNIMIYSADSVILKHQIQVGQIVKSFQFTKNCREIIVVTKDLKIRVYSLAKFEGIYLRELQSVHRGAVTCTDLSANGGYMLTGGEDNLVKIWDYDAQKNVPAYFQAFIGHTYPIVKTIFNPDNNGMVITTAENDGIYIWQFHGDTQSNFHPQIEDEAGEHAVTQVIDREALHQPTVLERMRNLVKEKKKPKLKEYAFYLLSKELQSCEVVDKGLCRLMKRVQEVDDELTFEQVYQEKKKEIGLNYNHFVSMQDKVHPIVTLDKQAAPIISTGEEKFNEIDPYIVNGYDGLSGVHDNLVWNQVTGMMTYTLNNKVIHESTKTRQQQCFAVSDVRLACMAMSPDGKYVAVGQGEANSKGESLMILLNIETGKTTPLNFFQKGVQSVAFSNDGRFLIGLGVHSEGKFVIYELFDKNHRDELMKIYKKFYWTDERPWNKIVVNPNVELALEFVLIGTSGQVKLCKMEFDTLNDSQSQEESFFETQDIEMSEDMAYSDIVCATYTPVIQAFNCSLFMMGTSDGGIIVCNPQNQEPVTSAQKKIIMAEEIGHISVKSGQVVIAGSQGMLCKYSIIHGTILPPEDPDDISKLSNSFGGVTALQMDDNNNEGIIGTTNGIICYINFADKIVIPIVNSVDQNMEPINHVVYDNNQMNSKVLFANCGTSTGNIKMYSVSTCDQVCDFKEPELGPIAFILNIPSGAGPAKRKFKLVGHQEGHLKLIDVDKLGCDAIYKVALELGETLTCGAYSPCGKNIAIGTSLGSIFFCQHRPPSRTGMTAGGFCAYRIDRISKTQYHAVTSIAMSNFTPEGTLLVAFDNGLVRTWQSSVREDLRGQMHVIKQTTLKKSERGKPPLYSFDEIQETLFELRDEFDMFYNPHGKFDYTDEEAEQDKKNYLYKKYPDCKVMFAAGSQGVHFYMCYVGALQYIFIRNYVLDVEMASAGASNHDDGKLTRINLNAYPTCMQAVKLTLGEHTGGRRGSLYNQVLVGTKQGKVICYQVDGKEHRPLLQTKAGISFGAVTSLSVQPGGEHFCAGTETGEIISFLFKANAESYKL